jgi:hypothetical protein
MEIPIVEGADAPVPPEQVRFRSAVAEPYADGRRLRLLIEITPFQKRPDVEIVVSDAEGNEVGSVFIIEAMEAAFTLTVHLRASPRTGPHPVRLRLSYTDPEVGDETEARFELPAAGEGPPETP